jgi:hypothetical protein
MMKRFCQDPEAIRLDGLVCIFLSVMFSLAAPWAASGQETLELMRKSFLQEVIGQSEILAEQYERALAKLETELASVGDYETAQKVKQRRDEILAVYYGGYLPEGAVVLGVDQVKVSGAAEVRGDEITGWRSSSAMAEWTAISVLPGEYVLDLEVSVNELPAAGLRTAPKDQVEFTLTEVSLLPGAEMNQNRFVVPSSQKDDVWQNLRIGPLRFERRLVALRLVPQAGYPANRVSFRHLRLLPTKSPVIQAADVPQSDALQESRAALEKTLVRSLSEVLRTHEEQRKQQGLPPDPHAAELSTVLKEKGAEKMLARLSKQSGNLQGWIDVENAKLIQPEKAEGDRFIIQHGDETKSVRLMWVEGIPLAGDGGQARSLAERLKLDAVALNPLASTSRDFTIAYLQGRGFRVMMRPSPGPDGSHLALVFIPGVGLYQNVLVEQGLAFVQPRDRRSGAGLEEGFYTSLELSQNRAQRLRNGAWAMTLEEKK